MLSVRFLSRVFLVPGNLGGVYETSRAVRMWATGLHLLSMPLTALLARMMSFFAKVIRTNAATARMQTRPARCVDLAEVAVALLSPFGSSVSSPLIREARRPSTGRPDAPSLINVSRRATTGKASPCRVSSCLTKAGANLSGPRAFFTTRSVIVPAEELFSRMFRLKPVMFCAVIYRIVRAIPRAVVRMISLTYTFNCTFLLKYTVRGFVKAEVE